MPVAKVKTYDTVTKNLRGREIPCFVIAVPKRNSLIESSSTEGDTSSSFIWLNEKNKRISGKKSYRKSNLCKGTPELKKRPRSLPDLNDNNALFEPPKKRLYRKKILNVVPLEPKFFSEASTDVKGFLPFSPAEKPKKRTYRKKSFSDDSLSHTAVNNDPPYSPGSMLKKRAYRKKSFSDDSLSHTAVNNDPPYSPGSMLKKRAYRKKSFSDASLSHTAVNNDPPYSPGSMLKKRAYRKKIPAVPHNTPVMAGYKLDTSSASSLSDLSQKRGRGRPPSAKKSLSQAMPVWDEESTCTSSTLSGLSQDSELNQERSTAKRVRRSRYFFDDFDTEEEEQLSEYELLRQRNIEQNMIMLRQIFTENGLQFEEKPSDTPKARRTYSKVPLPPPRPKSARIEIRSSFEPLDFSKFNHRLSVT